MATEAEDPSTWTAFGGRRTQFEGEKVGVLRKGDRFAVVNDAGDLDVFSHREAVERGLGYSPPTPHFGATVAGDDPPPIEAEATPISRRRPTREEAGPGGRTEEVSLDPEMTIGGAPDTYTTMEEGGERTGVAFYDSGEDEKAVEADPREAAPIAGEEEALRASWAGVAGVETGSETTESETSESPSVRKARIKEGFERKRDHYRELHRERMLRDKSAQLIRRRGYTWAEGVPRAYPYRPSRTGEKGSVAFVGGFPTSGKAAQQSWFGAQVGDSGRPSFTKAIRSKRDKDLYKRSYARYPPMRSRQGPARRRDPIRINDNILKAEEAARARWGWYRSEDVYVTT